MIIIRKNGLTAALNEYGAELKSLCRNEEQFIFPGDEKFWSNSAPLLFPICGGLKDDKYTYRGRSYTLPKHGFARRTVFTIEERGDSRAVFLLCSNEDTKKVYPFDFELRVEYTLEERSLTVGYRVKNTGKGDMYFSIGAHEAYLCPDGIENYDVIFPEKETLRSHLLDGNLLKGRTVPIVENSDTIRLNYDYFKDDALVFFDLVSRSAVLKNRESGRGVKVDFEGFPYFLLWTKPGAPYICVEPWNGIQDSLDSDGDITKKAGIIRLPAGEEFFCRHVITVLD